MAGAAQNAPNTSVIVDSPGTDATGNPLEEPSTTQTKPSVSTTPLPSASVPADTSTVAPIRKVGYNVGEQAPDFVLHSVTGETYTVSEVVASGKSVLLYFFASW